MRIPRAACINDLSGFGRCSLTTAIAVLSASGVQACPVPTAVLSKHTGFDHYVFRDLTDSMMDYMDDWNDIEFDGIYSGFLGSDSQIQAVESFIKKHDCCVVVDPVMGDSGKLYATYTKQMQEEMKRLADCADILTPNITEICFLTDSEYCGEDISPEQAIELIKKLRKRTQARIVLTGIARDDKMINMTYDSSGISISEVKRENKVFSGTGDIFSSVFTGAAALGKPLQKCLDIAVGYTLDCIKATIPHFEETWYGSCFELCIENLIKYVKE